MCAENRPLVVLPFTNEACIFFVLGIEPESNLFDPSATLADCRILTHATPEAEKKQNCAVAALGYSDRLQDRIRRVRFNVGQSLQCTREPRTVLALEKKSTFLPHYLGDPRGMSCQNFLERTADPETLPPDNAVW